ncbi:GntR family transcriptional regulator [Streptomyces pseudogriseolus]|uniref:GntR family transcriptional regulator n=1 Tax=Streptomyces pseudogriseolus TaxID=36817 RepID=UPI003FA2892F
MASGACVDRTPRSGCRGSNPAGGTRHKAPDRSWSGAFDIPPPHRQPRTRWSADIESRALEVDQVSVSEETAPAHISAVMDLAAEAVMCVRRRRFLVDSKPVLLATSYLPLSLVAGSAITQEDTGPDGTYARLSELGHAPVHFREEIRSRMPSPDELTQLSLAPGTPVILICRTAFTEEGHPVEVNEMTLDAASYVLEYDFDA